MRTAASSLCLRLLLLLIGLVLFVLCKPADGRQPATDTVTAKAADSGVKAASTAKVKKTKIHRKTRKSKPRATRRVTAKKQAANSGTIQISTPAVSVAKVSGDKDAKVAANATANTTVSAMNNATGKDRRGGTVAPTQAVPARAAALAGPAGAAGALAAAPKAGDRWIEPRTGMAFRYIPAGCFTMGSPKTEHGRERDEGPRHKVCVSGFWIGETEVTQGQWTAIMEDNPSLVKNGDDQPVDMISWGMAKKYAKALGAGGQETFRLPTEAEWEYACRAGTTTAYSYGDAITHDQASFDKPFVLPAQPLEPRRKSRSGGHHPVQRRAPRVWPNMHTSVVGSFPANAYGLYDMHGNLWEWCEDLYDAGFYSRSPRENPVRQGEGQSRVMRGGSWVTRAESLRSANRGHGWSDMRTAFYGLRLVRLARPAAEISH